MAAWPAGVLPDRLAGPPPRGLKRPQLGGRPPRRMSGLITAA
jgi:hypothetical protein